jgi:putative transcriptional regulator
VNFATDRLSPDVARKLIRKILKEGQVSWSIHAKEEFAKDALTAPDFANALRAGVVEQPEWENGSWRYRVWTQKITVVVAFRSAIRIEDRHGLESGETMKCLNCGAPMKGRKENYHYTESGLSNIVLADVEVRSCAKCGEREVVIPRLDELHRAIAHEVIEQAGKLEPDQIRFLRKYLGWSQADLAAYMSVESPTVSRWEGGHQEMGQVSDRLLRLLVNSQEPATSYPIDLFKHKFAKAAKATLKFEAKPTWRTTRRRGAA